MDNRYYFTIKNGKNVIIDGQEAQHLSKVRRCKVGDEIKAFNGDGLDYNLKVEEILKDKVNLTIVSTEENRAATNQNITVYLAMLKNDALTTAIDNLAELNVKNVKLFKSDYTVAVIDEKKLEKLNNISIQASKQSERADIMQVSIIKKEDIIKDIQQFENRFFAYEDSTSMPSKFKGDFAVIIGPEGGFSNEENKLFSSIANNISISQTILRAEVACVAAVSMLKAVSLC